MIQTLKQEYSLELNLFIPLKPWHGGPPQSNSTSPCLGNRWPREFSATPSMTSFSKVLQSSVKTVALRLFALNALAAGSSISIAQSVSAIPAWWRPSDKPGNT